MKLAIRRLWVVLADVIGWEGAFWTLGTVLLALGSSYLSPAGPWIVTGFSALVLGLVLAIAPDKRGN